jgi:hypothetical protein
MASRGAGLVRANRVTSTVGRLLPDHPDQQTFLVFAGVSQRYQQQTNKDLRIRPGSAIAPSALYACMGFLTFINA